jgi:hypothetical protein
VSDGITSSTRSAKIAASASPATPARPGVDCLSRRLSSNRNGRTNPHATTKTASAAQGAAFNRRATKPVSSGRSPYQITRYCV